MEGQCFFRGNQLQSCRVNLQKFSASLLFADDVVLLASSDCNLKQFASECDGVEMRIGSRIIQSVYQTMFVRMKLSYKTKL